MNVYPELLPAAFKMMAALAVVLGGLLLSFYMARRFIGARSGAARSSLVRVLSNRFLGGKKSIALVEIPGRILVLGVTSDAIRLLSTIDDKDTLMQIKAEDQKVAPLPFRAHLQKFSARLSGSPHEAQ